MTLRTARMWFQGLLALGFAALLLASTPALAQVSEAQRILNKYQLEAGKPDGKMGPATLKAWQFFLQHRGLPLDAPLDNAGLAELQGQTHVTMPVIKGFKPVIVGINFPSKDSYKLDPTDPTGFSVTLRSVDYDPVDLRNGSALFTAYGMNFHKQRAEIGSKPLKQDTPYTFDFEVNLDNVATGSFFQIHSATRGGAAFLIPYKDSIRFSIGEEMQNIAVYQGEWLGSWHKIRMVFMCDAGADSWFRIYVDGKLGLDTTGRSPRFPMGDCWLQIGLYRGQLQTQSTAQYRNLALAKGDLGAP